MKHTIFPGNRKRLHVPAYVNVCLRNGWKIEHDHLVYWSRQERDKVDFATYPARLEKVLYRINVYPKGDYVGQ
jgi:hypothetical protein